MPDLDARTNALHAALWAGASPSSPTSAYALLPGVARVQAMLPLGRKVRGAASASLRRRTNKTAPAEVLGRATLSGLARVGLLQPFLRDRVSLPATYPEGSLALWISNHFGREDLVFVGGLGQRRTNAKPVVQVLTPKGEVLAWVKIGTNPLTRQLVDHEFASLGRISTTSSQFVFPEPLAREELGDCVAILLGPLSSWARSIRRPDAPSASEMRALAAIGDGVSSSSLAESDFVATVLERSKSCSEEVGELVTTAATTAIELVDGPTEFGTFHGDFVPWNMLRHGKRLHIWDWERSRSSVPVGFDSIHFIAQSRPWTKSSTKNRARIEPDAVIVALCELGVHRSAVRPLICLYLAEMLLRYSNDGEIVGDNIATPLMTRYANALETAISDLRSK